ncbi:response regulator (plasmid) [Halorarum halophilum]|uniref:Response regulator n=1 Tax=Halorarum halophilum TaxID=2743090 RepID=A0A7D5KAH8_9EURY|nr:response regulator [Halobaculum halophilum]QLG29879.1 response regulator [Halobaculum halophilum]
MTSNDRSATVLIVEDEQSIADLYALSIVSNCTVLTAYDGTEALNKMNPKVDVVLLDRRMPGLSGEDVLQSIREEGYNCRVAMVTAVTPDVDILEMEIDDYLTKPVDRSELNETVSQLFSLNAYDELFQEYYQHFSKKAALEAERPIIDIEEDEEYTRLTNRLTELETKLEAKQKTASGSGFCNLLDRRRSRADGD